jgi:hypothetical protein
MPPTVFIYLEYEKSTATNVLFAAVSGACGRGDNNQPGIEIDLLA